MEKKKIISLTIIGLLLFLPFVKYSPAQESYVGLNYGDDYKWKLRIYKPSWGRYFNDYFEGSLGNLLPLGQFYNMTKVYLDWAGLYTVPPQHILEVHYPFNVISIGNEESGALLTPFDNTTITSTLVNATTGYVVPKKPYYNSEYIRTWNIANNTSSFLRQTLNLTLSFSVYGIMEVPFAPKTINWEDFITEFLGLMNSKGGLYNNISATALSNGYSLNVPAQGFENNAYALYIKVKYNSNGILTYYEFTYGGQKLVSYVLDTPSTVILSEDDLHSIIYGGVFMVIIALIVIMIKKIK